MKIKKMPEYWMSWLKSYRRNVQALLLTLWVAGGLPAFAAVNCTVDWSTLTGQSATPLHYGLNVFHGLNGFTAGSPGDSTYKANMAYMKPGIIRYHNAAQPYDSTNEWYGWVGAADTATYAWDRTKIRNALTNSYTFGPEVMMNIVRWPPYLNRSSTDERLQTNAYSAFAAFCADLVRIVNIEMGRGVKRWEILNEPEAHGYYSTMDEAARVYSVAALAMKEVDPTIKVGGPAFGTPENSTHRTKFISTVYSNNAPLDFITYHQYPDYADTAFTNSDTVIWNQAATLGKYTGYIRSTLETYYTTNNNIELFIDEYNINWIWDPSGEPRMATIKGAVWDALAMIANVKAGTTGAIAFNEGDTSFGKLGSYQENWVKHPGAHVCRLFNETQIGDVVSATSSATNSVAIFAQRNSTNRQFCLVNRSGTNQTVNLTFSGWAYPGDSTTVKLWQVSSSGITSNTLTLGSLCGSGLTLPVDTITFIVTAETATAPSAAFSASPSSGTAPLTVSFTDSSTGTITNRTWSFGDGATTNTTATSVQHVYSSTGCYTAQLTVRGPLGSDSDTLAVTANPAAPSAGLSASPSAGTAPLTVTFTDVSSGAITNRAWSFGDSATTNTTATSLQHTYVSTGSYTAQLTVSGPGGSDSESLDITVTSAGGSPTTGTNLVADVNDQQWRSSGVGAWVNSTTTRIGTEASGVLSGLVLPFWIPDLNGAQITNAELSISLPNSTGLSGATGAANIDVYGVRSDSSSSVTSSNDFTNGTLVVDNWLNISPSLTVGEKTVSSTNLAAWISAQVGTNGGKYVFITVRPDALDNSYRYATINTANAASNQPHLLLTCSVEDTNTQTGPVCLDLSGSYDYDAFVTGEEITYATAQTNEVRNVIGDHAVKFYTVSSRTGIAHLVNPGGTYSGIVSNGMVDSNGFELAKGLTAKFGTASGSTKVNNSIAVLPDGVSTSFSRTVTLASADQHKYSSLNLLVNGDRKLSAASSATLSVKYVGDSAWYTVWTETAAANVAGGCFGGTLDGIATYSNQSGTWTQVAVSDANGAVKVSNGLTIAGSGSSYMYKFATPVSLDSSRVLESFRMETTTSNKSYVNDVFLYAATATP